jgi:glycerol uptake facilitator-like aquaporin
MCVTGRMPWNRLSTFVVSQIAGAIMGVWVAHAMFDQSILQVSGKLRWSGGQWIAEIVAASGLLFTIFGGLRWSPASIPMLVGLYITAAYWFTASTSFANPAVTLARALSDSFAGISPVGVAPFIAAQLIGAMGGTLVSQWLFNGRDAPID